MGNIHIDMIETKQRLDVLEARIAVLGEEVERLRAGRLNERLEKNEGPPLKRGPGRPRKTSAGVTETEASDG